MSTHARLLLLLALCGCDAIDEPLPIGQATHEIVNGTRDPQAVALSPGQQLAIGWLHQRGNPGGPFCTGTIVRPNVVATAKHCTNGWRAGNLAFGVGQDVYAPVATFDVAELHEDPRADATILVLAEDATARVPELVPIRANEIPLDGAFDQSLRGTEVQAGGYGETRDRSRSGRWFASVLYTGADAVNVNVDGRGRQGICFGDSGGPVIALYQGQPLVLGVESNGDSSCVGEDRLTRLDAIQDWITSVVGEDVPMNALPEPDPEPEPEAEPPPEPEPEPEPEPDPEPEAGSPGDTQDLPDPPPLPEEDGPAPEGVPSPNGRGVECGDIDAIGACDGDTLLWCEAGELHELDCTAQGRRCVLGLATGGAVCESLGADDVPSPLANPSQCEGLPALGMCDGDVLVRCIEGSPIETDCAATGEICGDTSAGPVCYPPGAGAAPAATAAMARGGCDQAPAPVGWLALLGLVPLVRRRR